MIGDAGIGIGLVIAFIAGVVSFASPCCLPLVPACTGYMGSATGASDRCRSFLHGLLTEGHEWRRTQPPTNGPGAQFPPRLPSA